MRAVAGRKGCKLPGFAGTVRAVAGGKGWNFMLVMMEPLNISTILLVPLLGSFFARCSISMQNEAPQPQ